MATDSSTTDDVRRRLHQIRGAPEEQLGNRVISEGLRQLNLPGAYTRGLLAGKPGEQATSAEILGRMGVTNPSPLGTMAWDVATDPLTYAGPGLVRAGGAASDLLRAGGRALGEGASANPLANALRKFGAEEGGQLDWDVFGKALPNPEAQELFRQVGPDQFFKQTTGHGIERTPAHRLDILGERAGVPVHWGSPDVFQRVFHDYTDPAKYNLAAYYPHAPGIYNRSVVIPTTKFIWWNPALMRESMATQGSPRVAATGMLPPWLSTTDARHLGVHEMAHALHHRHVGVGNTVFERLGKQPIDPALKDLVESNISRYGFKNPQEAVAETATKEILSSLGSKNAIPAPIRKEYRREWEGPPIAQMKKELGL